MQGALLRVATRTAHQRPGTHAGTQGEQNRMGIRAGDRPGGTGLLGARCAPQARARALRPPPLARPPTPPPAAAQQRVGAARSPMCDAAPRPKSSALQHAPRMCTHKTHALSRCLFAFTGVILTRGCLVKLYQCDRAITGVRPACGAQQRGGPRQRPPAAAGGSGCGSSLPTARRSQEVAHSPAPLQLRAVRQRPPPPPPLTPSAAADRESDAAVDAALGCVQGYKQCVLMPAVIWGVGW